MPVGFFNLYHPKNPLKTQNKARDRKTRVIIRVVISALFGGVCPHTPKKQGYNPGHRGKIKVKNSVHFYLPSSR